jgi:hypothetical protein
VTALAGTLDAGETLVAAFPGHAGGAGGATRARVAAVTDRRVLLCKGKLLDTSRVGRVITAIPLPAFELERRDGYVRIGDEWVGAHLEDELALKGQRQFEAACAARAGKPTPPRLRLVDPQ